MGSLGSLAAELSSQNLDARSLQIEWSELTTPDEGVSQLRDQIDDLTIGDFGLVGHSAGALLASATVEHLAKRPRRLVLIDPYLLPGTRVTGRLAGGFEPSHLEALAGLDGRLPKWSQWGSASSWKAVLDNTDRRDEIEAHLPSLALSLVLAPISLVVTKGLNPVVIATSHARSYLLGDASKLGWEVHDWTTLGHLAPVTEPRTFARLLGPVLT